MRSRMTLSFVGVSVVATMVVPGHCYGTVRTWEHQAAVGRTPLVDLSSLADLPAGVSVYGKAEFSNPSGSIKDRIVEFILDEHERTGKLVRHSGQTIVAASSGNTAAALAMFSAMRGYQCKLITNRKTSQEKIQQLGAYGAEVIITASGVPVDSPEHYQNVETRLVAENPSWIGLNQYDNPLNPEAYYRTLGPELWEGTDGTITHFVAAGSTGGTVSGTARYLKERNPNIQIVMPDPLGSIFYDKWAHDRMVQPKSFEVEGVGKDSIPKALNLSYIDAMPRFSDEQAFSTSRLIARRLGMMVGGSAGGNVHAALELAKTLQGPAVVVAILCDSGTKYLSKIFNDQWMNAKGFKTDEAEGGVSWDHFKVGSLGYTDIL
ncbi:cystathionine beta-synthase [Chrysochromulina tobinii]|uniref:Cystathionine beta-synthase n=1 Tax=Chrysochromulina tobinii TaxID=1460289 RepID=A0A0M0JL82_9EUKA|nr:cystathionine beta-synthase [Chrysochromulina tobinii]|eukprot:KOO27245.1 cystathionine beta-synthase [Chrysochromulina sp. CCMP291]